MSIKKESFIAGVFRTKAELLALQEETGKSIRPLLAELDRQACEARRNRDIIAGNTVTKSGKED